MYIFENLGIFFRKLYLYLQELRTEKMEHFFESVSSLMSNLLRSCVEKSIYDLVDLVEEYFTGNSYEGAYNIMKDLGLPLKPHVVHFFMVGSSES